VYNIQKAVSRLDFAPQLKEIQITDIKKGLCVFTPKPDRPVSFAQLKTSLKKAGYTLDSAEITVVGTLERDGQGWTLVVDPSGQRFTLEGESPSKLLADAATGDRVEITGSWKTTGESTSAREVVSPRTLRRTGDSPKQTALDTLKTGYFSPSKFSQVSFEPVSTLAPSVEAVELAKPLAPIRTTTPGLTVYQGGAFTPRLYLIRQHLGKLDVNRQVLEVSISYTPSPRLQLEVQTPFSRTAFDNGVSSGSDTGLGNVTLWSKYRFYRTVKTYGDRQSAVRLGLELPTGTKSAPTAPALDAPAFVRQQLTPINGGFSPHFDIAFSQAGGRFIFGGNAEGILRTERDGYRLGHELRLNTDLEYVLLPRDYQSPGHELFVILETNFVQRGRGRLDGATVEGSKSTEYYIAPGLQYTAHPQFVIEGSVQIPVIRNTGPLVLRTDTNILLGVKYLF
jgi:hypothetical protein